MATPYIRQEDCQQKIGGTVCTYKGAPCFVDVNINFPVNQITITQPIEKVLSDDCKKFASLINVADPDFSVHPPELGYIQITENECLYLIRNPERRVKQGLHEGSMVSGGRYLFNKGMKVLWDNSYPSFEKVLESMVENPTTLSMCFNRHAALFRTFLGIELHYQGNSLGTVNATTKTVSLQKRHNLSFVKLILDHMNIEYKEE